MKKFDFIILALAIWRIGNMLVKEDGPWLMFEHLRLKAGLMPQSADHPMGVRETDPPGRMPGSLFTCVWCMSIWVAGVWTVFYALNKKIASWAAMPFALSAISCVIDRWDGWSDR